ncbi:MAG TPA: ATP phosphoribosyltransferase regulatory subunit [Gammaproteobacteria bacterium]
MLQNDRWLLPEGIEEVLPPQAEQLEVLRRRLLDLFHVWGYELVIPPFIEYLESLLTGTGNDLDLQTFKLTDQITGRLMGVRADMTPQVARIDAHQLRRDVPSRLCYLGTVLHTRPQGHGATRSPLQVGAELYGHAGIESDIEVLSLMVETLRCVGVGKLHLDLGHVGIYRGLMRRLNVNKADEAILFDALQRKAQPEISEWLSRISLTPEHRAMVTSLADLHGDASVLEDARQLLAGAGAEVAAALDNLAIIARAAALLPEVELHFDLAELRGYHYHTGAVFAAYVPGQGQAIAQGGRYDDIGRVFGRARPATGFSTDLKRLLSLVPAQSGALRGIFAPVDGDPALVQMIATLRQQGERVIRALPGQPGGPLDMGCDRELTQQAGGWQVVPSAQKKIGPE